MTLELTPPPSKPISNPIEKPSILEQSLDALSIWLSGRGHPRYRAKQILAWVYHHRAASFADMTDLPKALRSELEEAFDFFRSTTVETQDSEDGTQKLLLQLHDGGRIECVLLRDGPRRSICVSSQVGCAMGCVFCASGLDGVDRNLTRPEILEQMLKLQRLLPPDERLSHIVMMGMGEPLANLPRVLDALSVAKDPEIGLGISPRRITISTVGIPASIDKLAEDRSPYHLAISLHAPNDLLRSKLVPVNKKIGIEPILAAADRYFQATGRRLTFEYVLLKDLNDSPECIESWCNCFVDAPQCSMSFPTTRFPVCRTKHRPRTRSMNSDAPWWMVESMSCSVNAREMTSKPLVVSSGDCGRTNRLQDLRWSRFSPRLPRTNTDYATFGVEWTERPHTFVVRVSVRDRSRRHGVSI